MSDHDPILRIEMMIREIHDRAGARTRPVLRRYPLIFAFLLAFSGAAIFHGFDLLADKIPLFEEHPADLVALGVAVLLLTGALYKVLDKPE